MKLKSMSETLDHDLQDPEYVALYLNDALHEGSPEEFYLALRNVIQANQGMTQIAASTERGLTFFSKFSSVHLAVNQWTMIAAIAIADFLYYWEHRIEHRNQSH